MTEHSLFGGFSCQSKLDFGATVRAHSFNELLGRWDGQAGQSRHKSQVVIKVAALQPNTRQVMNIQMAENSFDA